MRLSDCKGPADVERMRRNKHLCRIRGKIVEFVEPSQLTIVPYGESYKAIVGQDVLADLYDGEFLKSWKTRLNLLWNLKIRYHHFTLIHDAGGWRFEKSETQMFPPLLKTSLLKNDWGWEADFYIERDRRGEPERIRVEGYAELASDIPLLKKKMLELARLQLEKRKEALSRLLENLENLNVSVSD